VKKGQIVRVDKDKYMTSINLRELLGSSSAASSLQTFVLTDSRMMTCQWGIHPSTRG
jgi:hypothetical protein